MPMTRKTGGYPVSFADGTYGSPVTGTTSLLQASASAPEGLLLKRITCLGDALSCGGLLLINYAQEWQFLVGSTLRQAIIDDSIGMSVSFKKDQPNINVELVSAMNGLITSNNGRRETTIGGRMTPKYEPHSIFDRDVSAYGIVTSASEGYGQSSNCPPPTITSDPWLKDGYIGFGYMSTICPMDLPFHAFMDTMKAKALELSPSEARQYYASTYAAAMDKFVDKNVYPSIGVNTYWRNGKLDTVIDRECVLLENTSLSGYENCAGVAPGAYGSVVVPGDINYSQAVTIVTNKAPHIQRVFQHGLKVPEYGGKPFVFEEREDLPPQYGVVFRYHTPGTGVIGGLDVGQIRDGHVMGRSMVQNLRFATDTANYPDLASFVMDQLPRTKTVVYASGAISVSDATNAIIEGGKQKRRPETIYSTGNIVHLMDDFSDVWDATAQAAARATTP